MKRGLLEQVKQYKYHVLYYRQQQNINPLSPELNLIYYLLALLAHDFLHVTRIRVK
jgi:hypothetical protein